MAQALRVEGETLTTFKKRVDDLLTQLEESKAAPRRIAGGALPTGRLGSFDGADALHASYVRVHSRLEQLSKMLALQIEGRVVTLDASKSGYHNLDDGQHGPQVDLVAPGEDMVAACLESKTGVCETHGTSDATAIASASAALIWSKHLNWTNNQVLRVMLNTTSKPKSGKERTDYLGYGAVHPRIALTDPGDPGPADKYPLPDLAAAGANSPSPGASDTKGAGELPKDDSSAAAASASKDGGGNSTLWIGLGIGAAVLLGGAIAALAVARKRQRLFASPSVSTAPADQLPYSHSPFLPPTSASGNGGPPSQGERT
ncbi:S8 family serine peptidase [Streptomyces mirabilis]|uniref:S8 family serine peptidase n=1 Tax=Streptomyces mirabilis TaxID=68239 RepID=UPI0036B06E0E